MTLLFLILILSLLAVVCVGAAIVLRIRRHMREPDPAHQERVADVEQGPGASHF